jgi:UDP-N-acetylglucosamine:LPS N-acetylglucosamine transferase
VNGLRALCRFIGYILPFNPLDYAEKVAVRKKLGYGQEPLVICSIGGTSIGVDLLTLCSKAYPIIKEHIPNLRMVLVCGPRLSPEVLEVPQGVEVRKYVPNLFEHFAAADLAIVLGGATSTLELTALNRPFIYFPLEGHFEQAYVANRLYRHQAGIKMHFPQTSSVSLAGKILFHIGEEVRYEPIPIDGAQKAAQLINQLF